MSSQGHSKHERAARDRTSRAPKPTRPAEARAAAPTKKEDEQRVGKTAANPTVKKGIGRLIELGRERGFVTYEDISRIAPQEDLLPEDLKNAVSILSDNDIEIVEGFAEESNGTAAASDDSDDAFFGDEADWGVDEAEVPAAVKEGR